jgi:thymidylate kinase
MYQLVDALNTSGVRYCHWKSNFDLPQAMTGELDLDFLVERQSLSRALSLLLDLGFKSATARWGPRTPSTYHYYGLDLPTGLLLHVHLFSSVISGESFVKSHVFPFEALLLENTDTIAGVRVPSKVAELVVFVLRNFVKYGSLLDLVYLIKNRSDIVSELHWLRENQDLSESETLLGTYCPTISVDLFRKCVDALEYGALGRKVMLAMSVRRRLRVYAKRRAVARAINYVQVLWAQVYRRLCGGKKNKQLHAGGAVIAFVGPEATGKSTFVSDSARWLGSAFAVTTVHAGKPPSTWFTLPVNTLLPWARRVLPSIRVTQPDVQATRTPDELPKAKTSGVTGLIYALRAVSLAWDRSRLLVDTRRAAANGDIVICDRYPSQVVGAMDSPRLRADQLGEGFIAPVYNWLSRLEQRIYRRIPPPDIVLQLNVSIATAKQRNQTRVKTVKESDAYVELRHRQYTAWRMTGVKSLREVDTERPLQESIEIVRKLVWEAL